MTNTNTLQKILDKYLDFTKKSVSSGINAAGFWQKVSNNNKQFKEYTRTARIINDVFLAIEEIDKGSTKQKGNIKDLYQKIDTYENTSVSFENTGKSRRFYLKVAAILLPIAIIASIFLNHFQREKKDSFQIISTYKGGKTKITLEDGTLVWLNADSELKYPSTFTNKNKRVVSLVGEAFFEVSRNEKKPFEVLASVYKVKVLGTAFNVKAYPGEGKFETTLEHGKVNIEKIDTNENQIAQKLISLKPKQTLVIYEDGRIEENLDKQEDKENESIKTMQKKILKENALLIESENIEPYIAWKDNKLVFNETPLYEVAKELERWYDIKVKIADEQIKDIEFSATFINETAEQAIYALAFANKIDYKIEKNLVILKLNKKTTNY